MQGGQPGVRPLTPNPLFYTCCHTRHFHFRFHAPPPRVLAAIVAYSQESVAGGALLTVRVEMRSIFFIGGHLSLVKVTGRIGRPQSFAWQLTYK